MTWVRSPPGNLWFEIGDDYNTERSRAQGNLALKPMKPLVEKADREMDWGGLADLAQWTIDQAIAIQQIPAPTFQEAERAAYIANQFTALHLTDVETDSALNVYGRLSGAKSDVPAIMVSAHTDTVFALDTDLQTRTESGIIYGPGLGDNSLGVAGLLALVEALRQQQRQPATDLWLVATTREEGLGDLQGMRAAFGKLKSRIGMVINLEGLAFGHIYHAGIAVRRLQIKASAEGGHSWLHFGRASAVHGLVELGARIVALRPPPKPRTTFNIGMIEGGQAINVIATSASLWLDMRSEDRTALENLEQRVRTEAANLSQSDLTLSIQVVGDRPAGHLSPEHPLIQGALAALTLVGMRGALETGSTDANIPLADECPAVTIGIARGGNAHRLDEYVETEPIPLGLRQLITLTLAAAEYQVNLKQISQ